MANRIPWDQAETALLIDTYNKVETGQISMREAVSGLSNTLRQRALNAGVIIDEIYRNENGIQMMLGKIRYLMTGGKKGLLNTSRLFHDMVILYQTDSSAFQHILKAAKEPAVIGLSIKKSFYEWLRRQADAHYKELQHFIEETDAYAQKSGLLSTSLLDIQDINQIERLQEAIRSNLLLRLLQSKKHSRMIEACTWLLQYLHSLNSTTTKTTPVGFSIDSEPLAGVEASILVAHQSTPDIDNISSSSFAIMEDAEGKGNKYEGNTPPEESEPDAKVREQKFSQVSTSMMKDEDFLCEMLDDKGVAYIDHRTIGGNLWIIGGLELRPIVNQFMKHHIHFHYRQEGGRNTDGKSAWWTRDTLIPEKPEKELPALPANKAALKPLATSDAVKEHQLLTRSDEERYSQLLAVRFPNGFRLNSRIELKRFRTAWHKEYEQELQDDDAALLDKVQKTGVEYEGFIYHLDSMLSIEKRKILLRMIDDWLFQGRTTVFFNALYQAFSEHLQGQGINSPGMLRACINAINPGHYKLENEFLALKASVSESSPLKDLETYLLSQRVPISLENIQTALPHLPQATLLQFLRFQPCFVNSGTGEYFHLDIVDITAEELQQLEQTLKHLVELNQFVSGEEMVTHLRECHPSIMDRYEHISTLGLRKALAILMKQQFSFVGNIISAKGQELSVADIYARFCQGRQRFTLDELYTLRDNIGPNPTIYFDTVYQNALRVSQGQFVSKKEARFAVEEIDAAIGRYCVVDYIPIKAVTGFSAFPVGGFPWNHFLLEHYVHEFSPGFRLLHNGFAASQPAGAIVRRETPYQELRDVLIHDLANNSVPLEKGAILDDFYQKGYIARRRLADVEYIITSAKNARNKKGMN